MSRQSRADEINNRVREWRTTARLSQGDLAAMVGITRQAVSAIESGSYVPNTAVALRLSAALECSVEDLFRVESMASTVVARAAWITGEWDSPDQRGMPFGPAPTRDYRVQLARVGEELIASPMPGSDHFTAADGIGRALLQRPGQLVVDLLVAPDVPDRTVVVLGCDPSLHLLAQHVHRQSSETRVIWRHAGSIAALHALRAGEAHIAGTHLWDPETGESNLPIIRRELAGIPVVVVALSEWQQGLMVQPGNPKGIRSVSDLVRPDISIVTREPGAGSRRLLDHHLAQAGIQTEWINGHDRMLRSHVDVAVAVRDGLAATGPGILAAAHACGLDFIPLQEERYDLVIPTQFINERPVRTFLDTLTGQRYRREIETLGGYDSSVTGTVIEGIGT